MEPHQQYALYDGDGSGTKQWVAHVRLTPELLQRLQQKPHSVSIQLQAPGSTSGGVGGRTTRTTNAPTKLSTVLTVDEGDGEEPERYELLSFAEDPKVNVVCAFRKDLTTSAASTATSDDESKATEPVVDGYSLYEVGRVYQKLIVQRMLDSTEKDRMKDRHAKSVLESKSRASKLLKDEDMKTTRASTRGKKNLSTKSIALPHGVTPGSRARAAAEVISPAKRRKLASALTPEAAQELQDRISKGGGDDDVEMGTEEETVGVPATRNTIFSSDSELEKSPTQRPQPTPVVAEAKEAVVDVLKPKPAKKASAKREAKPKAMAAAETEATSEAKRSIAEAEAKESRAEAATAEEELPAVSAPVVEETPPMNDDVNATRTAPYMLKSARRTGTPIPRVKRVPGDAKDVNKRARPRLSRLPDISFLPQEIQDICKHVSSHITRTAILDADDHESFAAEYERFRNEWEQLDKAYSIESILLDGAHFQLPFATTEEEKQVLRARIDGAEKKKEGLLFLRESMGTIHKILASLQASIATYEQRTAAAASST